MPFSGEQQQVLLGVARQAIRLALAGKKPPAPQLREDEHTPFHQHAGCFVSLHEIETHRLRGCVGRLESTLPLLIAVHESAINVLGDPRFTRDPVTVELLPKLDLELTILSPLEKACDCLDFEPDLHGIFLTVENRSGCFLPQVARETGWSREQLLERLSVEKLGLAPQAWQQPSAKLFRFTAEIIGPEPFESGGTNGLVTPSSS